MSMYSPKIREDLIPKLYKLKRRHQKAMTHIIDEILRPEVLKRYAEIIQEEQVFYDYDDTERSP